MISTGEWTLELEDPDCISPAVAVEALTPAPWRRMVVLGDSVALGVREPLAGYRDACFADRIGETLAASRDPFSYKNLGERDLRLREIRTRQLSAALERRPDIAMVVAGGNDALARTFDATAVREDLLELVTPLAEAGAFVVTIGLFDLARSGLLPPQVAPLMTERFDALDAITASVSDQIGGLHVDTHHHPRAADPAIYSSDRIHANSRGHAIAFAAIVAALSTAGRHRLSPPRNGRAGRTGPPTMPPGR